MVRGSSSSREAKEVTEVETKEEFCLLSCSLWLAQLSYITQDYLSRNGSAHSRLGPSKSVINQENTLSEAETSKSLSSWPALSELAFSRPARTTQKDPVSKNTKSKSKEKKMPHRHAYRPSLMEALFVSSCQKLSQLAMFRKRCHTVFFELRFRLSKFSSGILFNISVFFFLR